jgi:hypothetical protein
MTPHERIVLERRLSVRRFVMISPAVLLSLALVSTASAQTTDCADYGDAPDGALAGYVAPWDAVTGMFPSTYANDGARNLDLDQGWCTPVSVMPTSWGALKSMYRREAASIQLVESSSFSSPQEWLGSSNPGGASVSYELDSEQVDVDMYDDGVSPLGFTFACNPAQFNIEVCVDDADGGRYGPSAENLLYINILFDWNKDGVWGGLDEGVCPFPVPEWALQNFTVDPSTWAPGQNCSVIPVPVNLGRFGPAWMRVTLTYGEPIPTTPEWTGTGVFSSGETEDLIILLDPSGPTH